MRTEDREREFRLRPPRRRPKATDEPRKWSAVFKRMMRFVRMSSRGAKKRKSVTPPRRFQQRCAVRVTYSPNRSPGQWAAHGRYLVRESATHAKDSDNSFGFDPSGQVSNIPATLRHWQTAGDPRLFKLIISPEFGDRCELESLTRDLLVRMEADLGTRLEWVATAHYNTGLPHGHAALRGLTERNPPLRLDRSYIQHGIRTHAENLTTRQIGYRTVLDAEAAERREIQQTRFTSLDRVFNRSNTAPQSSKDQPGRFTVDFKKLPANSRRHHVKARLLFLETLDLAKSSGSNRWLVRSDFQTILEAMQSATDRQRTLARYSTMLSDSRLPVRLTDPKQLNEPLEGRILGHVEDERTGRAYMILEGTDHNVHFIWHTVEIESARHQRKLASDSFVRIDPHRSNEKTVLFITDLGSSEQLLSNAQQIRNRAQLLVKRGIVPGENGWAGWLGRYDAYLARTVQEIQAGQNHESKRKDLQRPGLSR